EQAILQGISELGLEQEPSLQMVHGSTVATNAVLEGKGVKTAYITNRGFADTLSIGRQNRRHLYQLQPLSPGVPVEPDYCLETGGRLAADGSVLEPLTQAGLHRLQQQLQALAPEAVAINLLFSFLDSTYEQAIEAIIPERIFVSRSSAILPEYREYERGITTWLNAWVGPLVENYLQRLRQALPQVTISVMQSSGGTIAAELAGAAAVNMLLSGPAGGLAAARYVGAQCGESRLLTFDMGGTSTDVALIDGELKLTSEGQIAGYPVAVPMVDMHTIGAGGGSIASIDTGGLLQVGPESAGAAPGPACYGRGGERATVTDANLVLGRLRADAFLGGGMALDEAAARGAVATLAETLGLSVEETALGIIRIANEHMARALRVMSVQRGIDAAQLCLVSFGGAGGLHVCALAEAMGMSRALIPIHGGVLSALGMLVAPRSRQLSRTHNALLSELDNPTINAALQELIEQGQQALLVEGLDSEQLQIGSSLDLRYEGQSYTLNLPWSGELVEVMAAYHRLHKFRYGHVMQELEIELVNLRVQLQGPEPEIPLQFDGNDTEAACEYRQLYGLQEAVAMYVRSELKVGQRIEGPALISEQVASSFIANGWSCTVHTSGSLQLQRLPD
ncbi:MAG: hydantoinase/oxoprolinase family protein, partial [Gammaproteobacteria bacterium]|nr:hydantoinase/oxoprolinase family protein [Gammaproteobacteria bacterium]